MLQKSYENPRLKFAGTLRSIRINLHITQLDLAELSDIGRGRISEYECGKRIPTQVTLNKLCSCITQISNSKSETEKLRRAWDISLRYSSGKVTGRVLR